MHRQLITKRAGIFCVSEKCDDLLMWAHYADSHRGVCLEFDGFGELMAPAQQVDYVPTRQTINRYADDPDAMVTKALFTKSDHWTYEAEWRLLRTDKGPGAVPFSPHNLTGLIIGARATRETVETVRQWVAQRSMPLALYRASISNKEFKLSVKSFKGA